MSTGVIGSEDACLEELGITTTSPDAISGCADSDEGSLLLHDLGVATHGLNPPLTFVPWVIFNDVSILKWHADNIEKKYNSGIQRRSLANESRRSQESAV